MSDITIKIKDRDGKVHEVAAPTDMNINMMELCKIYELPVEGICGGHGSLRFLPVLHFVFGGQTPGNDGRRRSHAIRSFLC